MAFTKKTWKDRLVEYAGRRKITNTSTNESQIVDVERAEGTVSEEGSAFSAANMNDLEQRISDEFGELNIKIGNVETSFQDGCSTIAAAITSMGVSTSSTASPDTMAANIKKLAPKVVAFDKTSWVTSLDVSVGTGLKSAYVVFTYLYRADGGENNAKDWIQCTYSSSTGKATIKVGNTAGTFGTYFMGTGYVIAW